MKLIMLRFKPSSTANRLRGLSLALREIEAIRSDKIGARGLARRGDNLRLSRNRIPSCETMNAKQAMNSIGKQSRKLYVNVAIHTGTWRWRQ